MFGHIPGVAVGHTFADRYRLAVAGVHRPPVAGICGRASEGAESVVLSGGFVDDEDFGDTILYTGAGGRNVVTGRQVAPQSLNRTNLALATSQRLGLPVRVVRLVVGRDDRFYRYDGLYRVAEHFAETGRDGFRIWRFRLERAAETIYGPPREHGRVSEPGLFDAENEEDAPTGDEAPLRSVSTVSRVIHDTAVTREIKRLHGFRCQMCGERVETPTGPYAEAAHIWPLGRPHDGHDVVANVLCLCPNHHSAFDLYGVGIADDLSLVGLPGRLRTAKGHDVGAGYLRYRHTLFDAAQNDAADAARRAA